MAGYVHRRLRPGRGPRWALVTPARITREEAAAVARAWRVARRKDTVVLSGGWDVRVLR